MSLDIETVRFIGMLNELCLYSKRKPIKLSKATDRDMFTGKVLYDDKRPVRDDKFTDGDYFKSYPIVRFEDFSKSSGGKPEYYGERFNGKDSRWGVAVCYFKGRDGGVPVEGIVVKIINRINLEESFTVLIENGTWVVCEETSPQMFPSWITRMTICG